MTFFRRPCVFSLEEKNESTDIKCCWCVWHLPRHCGRREKAHTGVSSQVAPGGGGKGENQKTPLPTHTCHSWAGRPWVSHYPLMGLIHQAKGTSRACSLALKTRLRGHWGINSKNIRALRDELLFLQWKPRKEGAEFVDESSPWTWTSSLPQITGPPPQVHSGGTAALSHRWHNKLWATSGAVGTWGPQTPRLGPWIMWSSLSLLLSFATRNSSLLLSVSLCHLSYYHLKALWQHPVCRVTSPLRILGIHCPAAFSGPPMVILCDH